MKVLLLCENLFALAPNGGSRVYEKIVSANPEIDFYAFTNLKSFYPHPKNLSTIEITDSNNQTGLKRMLHEIRDQKFDAIDWPDWIVSEINPRRILDMYGVKFRKLCISLHGNTSSVLDTSPFKNSLKPQIDALKILEHELYTSSDLTYGISKHYANFLGITEKFALIEPAYFIKKFSSPNVKQVPSNLIFLGRRESTKGFGNFLSILSSLPTGWRGEICGPDSYSWKEYRYWNRKTYALREKIQFDSTLTENEVTSKYSGRDGTYAFLSEFDSFNLACADAFSSGQAVILYEDLPALSYFLENGIEIRAKVLPKSVRFEDSNVVINILESSQFSGYQELERMRGDIFQLLNDKTVFENFMIDVYDI